MRCGSMTRVARSRKKTVSSTASPSSWPISSSPVASGTGEALLGANRVVALAPAGAGMALNHGLELQNPVHQGLRTWRAARDVHVDGHELVGRHERVVV